MLWIGDSDLLLEGLGLEICVADLDGNRSGELAGAPQLKSKVFGHSGQDAAELADVDGVLVKGTFVGNGFALVVGFYGAFVDTLGFGPDAAAVFAERLQSQGAVFEPWHHAEQVFVLERYRRCGDKGFGSKCAAIVPQECCSGLHICQAH